MTTHAYRPRCPCPDCDRIRVVTDRATLRRIAIAEHDWAGVAPASLIPERDTEEERTDGS